MEGGVANAGRIGAMPGLKFLRALGKRPPRLVPFLGLRDSRARSVSDTVMNGVCHVYLCAWEENASGPFLCTIETLKLLEEFGHFLVAKEASGLRRR